MISQYFLNFGEFIPHKRVPQESICRESADLRNFAIIWASGLMSMLVMFLWHINKEITDMVEWEDYKDSMCLDSWNQKDLLSEHCILLAQFFFFLKT